MLEKERRTETLHFRCSGKEKAVIEKKAEQEGKMMSMYLRDAALNRRQVRFPRRIQKELEDIRYNELKIGTNINQIVKLCNTKGYITRMDYMELVRYLENLMVQRKQIIRVLLDMSDEKGRTSD